MGQQWGMLGAALIGFAGLFVGLIVGRRQVADQAQVEHGQWLRAQRQEAYVQLLDSWETAVRKTEEVVDDEGHQQAEEQGWDWGEHIIPAIDREVTEAWEPVWRAVERVELIGPDAASEAANGLRVAGRTIVSGALDFDAAWPNRARVEAAMEEGRAARRSAVTAAAGVVQTAPRPGRRR
ncbi:hypothetical protein OG800_50795 (plasmid) [Streptomyces sp. NBC_00445]|uniref:hypothetical protein n=1 Tax=Streptomyces sp. NBC_00445 TaxID=2975745 RepID=UPI002E1AAE96